MPPTPQTTPPPVSQEKVNDLIAKSNLKTSSNGCYGEICTLKVPLPAVENLYKPFEGYFQKKYSAAASGMVNPNSSWSEKLIYGTLATAVSPLALVEGMGTGILNAPNSAARMGQNLAAAVQSSETSDRVTHSLQTVVDFAEGFTGLGGAVVLKPTPIKAKPPVGGVAVEAKPKTVFSGHGGLEKGSGSLVVPEGTQVTTYSKPGGSISDTLGNAIETGKDMSGLPSKTFLPGETMPNYTLYPPDKLNILGSPITVDSPTKLSDLLKPNMGSCQWAACTHFPGTPNSNLIFDLNGVFDKSIGQYVTVYKKP
jgi:hypothetical protein